MHLEQKDECFLNFQVQRNQLGALLKCNSDLGSPRSGLRAYTSNNKGDAEATGAQAILRG